MRSIINNKKSTRACTLRGCKSLLECKRSQAELITTVLLILVAIAAVWLVATFIINLVNNYLKPTDCFKTTGQLMINFEGDYTYYDSASKTLYLSITRGETEFNLTGISVIYGNGPSSNKVKIVEGNSSGDFWMSADNTLLVILPKTQVTKTYAVNATTLGADVTKVSIAPSLTNNIDCKETDSKSVSVR